MKEAAAAAAGQAEAKAELVRIEGRLAELAKPGRAGADESEASRLSLADPARQTEITTLRAEWNDAYWRSFGWWEHKTVTGSQPKLYDCFNQSDAMVSDISSVVSDFIASGKPYAVTDSAELGADEFKRQNTAVRAAVILSNSAAEIDELLRSVADPASDPLAEGRHELKTYLLGPDEPTSMEQFNAAVLALAAKAETRNAGVAQRVGGQQPPAPCRTPRRRPAVRVTARPRSSPRRTPRSIRTSLTPRRPTPESARVPRRSADHGVRPAPPNSVGPAGRQVVHLVLSASPASGRSLYDFRRNPYDGPPVSSWGRGTYGPFGVSVPGTSYVPSFHRFS